MAPLVSYSLALPEAEPRPDLLWQLHASVRSLRAYNQTVRVLLFVYGDVPRDLGQIASTYGIEMAHLESYEQRLARLCPHASEALSRYPLLHKFLNFSEIAATDPSQVLVLDCDTLFFDDVERLFERYDSRHIYAREEPNCRRSPHGYDASYLDEDLLTAVATSIGARVPPPFNLGAVLLNHGIWNLLAPLAPVQVEIAARLVVWMALNPPCRFSAAYGDSRCAEHLRRTLAPHELAAYGDLAIPYPSGNRWILDQVVLWLSLGLIEGVTYDDFSDHDVLQNGEFMSRRETPGNWILCHYYSQNTERLANWVERYLSESEPSTRPLDQIGCS